MHTKPRELRHGVLLSKHFLLPPVLLYSMFAPVLCLLFSRRLLSLLPPPSVLGFVSR